MKKKVRFVMKKKVTCMVLALLCGVAGCGGPSVEQARREALARLDGMVFLVDEKKELRAQLEAATSAEQVTRLIEGAAQEEASQADEYWDCAGRAAAAIASDGWKTITTSLDGREKVEATLKLDASGAASLTETDRYVHGTMNGTDVSPKAEWVASHVGKVRSWSSDASELVEKRTWIGDYRPRFSHKNSCNFHFNMKIDDDDPVLVNMDYSIGNSQLIFTSTSDLFFWDRK